MGKYSKTYMSILYFGYCNMIIRLLVNFYNHTVSV